MPVTLAIRFDSAKNAEIAAIFQISSSLNPWLATALKSAYEMPCASVLTFIAKSSMAFWRGVIGKERPEFVRAICQRQEHIGDEAGLLLHREQAGADVVRQLVDGRRREALCNGLRHGAGSGSGRMMRQPRP